LIFMTSLKDREWVRLNTEAVVTDILFGRDSWCKPTDEDSHDRFVVWKPKKSQRSGLSYIVAPFHITYGRPNSQLSYQLAVIASGYITQRIRIHNGLTPLNTNTNTENVGECELVVRYGRIRHRTKSICNPTRSYPGFPLHTHVFTSPEGFP
jgi:hypothetical protein